MIIDVTNLDSNSIYENGIELSEIDTIIDNIVNEVSFDLLIEEHTSLLESAESFKEKAKNIITRIKEKIIEIFNTIVNSIRKAYATILYKSAENQKRKINYDNLSKDDIAGIINSVLDNAAYYSYEKIQEISDFSKDTISIGEFLEKGKMSDKEKRDIISPNRYTKGSSIDNHMKESIRLCTNRKNTSLSNLNKYGNINNDKSAKLNPEEYMNTCKSMFNQYSAIMKAIVNNAKVDIAIIKKMIEVSNKSKHEKDEYSMLSQNFIEAVKNNDVKYMRSYISVGIIYDPTFIKNRCDVSMKYIKDHGLDITEDFKLCLSEDPTPEDQSKWDKKLFFNKAEYLRLNFAYDKRVAELRKIGKAAF